MRLYNIEGRDLYQMLSIQEINTDCWVSSINVKTPDEMTIWKIWIEDKTSIWTFTWLAVRHIVKWQPAICRDFRFRKNYFFWLWIKPLPSGATNTIEDNKKNLILQFNVRNSLRKVHSKFLAKNIKHVVTKCTTLLSTIEMYWVLCLVAIAVLENVESVNSIYISG